jgi:hypothetical protein
MLSFLEGAAWLVTLALVLKLLDYRVPGAHHIEKLTEPPATEQPATEQRLPPEPPTALRAGQSNFLEGWSNANNDD